MKIFSRIKAQLGRKPKEKPVTVVRLGEVDSTNNYLRTYQPAAEGEDMVVVTADHQTAGRGQGTNRWESAEGMNLLFSVLIHPSWIPVGRQFLLSEAGALAIKEVLDGYTEGITLKWPNDIYWNDRKLSGTLIETAVSSQGLKKCVYGIGLNVNQTAFSDALPNPVSLKQIVGHDVDREQLLQELIVSFKKYYELTREGAYGDISELYFMNLYHRDGYYRFRDKEGEFEGRIFGVEDDGRLLLHDRQGCIREYSFKEVEFMIPAAQ